MEMNKLPNLAHITTSTVIIIADAMEENYDIISSS